MKSFIVLSFFCILLVHGKHGPPRGKNYGPPREPRMDHEFKHVECFGPRVDINSTNVEAVILSPGFDEYGDDEWDGKNRGAYYPMDRCMYKLKAPRGAKVILHVVEMNIKGNPKKSCKGDALQVRIPGDRDSWTVLCGKSVDEWHYFGPLPYGKMNLIFNTNGKGEGAGFKIIASLDEEGPSTENPTSEITTPVSTGSPTPTQPPGENCGVVPKNRIVGGSEAPANSIPWQIGLVSKGGSQIWCGGTLVSEKHVITAGHCLNDAQAGTIEVLLGEHSMSASESTTVRRGVSCIKVHEEYSSKFKDIAIVTLDSPVDITGNSVLRPACLPTSTAFHEYIGNEKLTVSGWGRLTDGGAQPDKLQKADVTYVKNKLCHELYSARGYSVSQTWELCAAADENGAQGGIDSCQGDSGGPLTWQPASGGVQLVGVVSWGVGCAAPKLPGVYARVTYHLDWIKKHTAADATCQ